MVNYKRKIDAEYEAIEYTISSLPDKPLTEFSQFELGGIATILYNFYNGVENIISSA